MPATRGDPLQGSRSAHDVTDPALHATDLENSIYKVHLDPDADEGAAMVGQADGTWAQELIVTETDLTTHSGNASAHHAPVTLGAGNDADMATLSTQALTVVLKDHDHTAASGDGGLLPSLSVGDVSDGDYASINTDGTVQLHGEATSWEDLRISGSNARLGATAPSVSAFGPSGGLYALRFNSGQHDEIYFEVQMPHAWLEGSNIHPHVHWTPVSATEGNVVWQLEYAWANIDGTFGAPSNMASDAQAAGGTAWVHKLAKLKESGNEYIDGTGKTLSSMLVCRLHRDAGAGDDTLAADVSFLEFDLHYQVDSFGSASEYIKAPYVRLLLETGDEILLETGDYLLGE